jgi:hypothetical protein
MAATGDPDAVNARPTALVVAVKAKVFNIPRLPVTIFTAGISCLLALTQMGSRSVRGH